MDSHHHFEGNIIFGIYDFWRLVASGITSLVCCAIKPYTSLSPRFVSIQYHSNAYIINIFIFLTKNFGHKATAVQMASAFMGIPSTGMHTRAAWQFFKQTRIHSCYLLKSWLHCATTLAKFRYSHSTHLICFQQKGATGTKLCTTSCSYYHTFNYLRVYVSARGLVTILLTIFTLLS